MKRDSFMEMNAAHHSHSVGVGGATDENDQKPMTENEVTCKDWGKITRQRQAKKSLDRIQVVKPGDPRKLGIKIAI